MRKELKTGIKVEVTGEPKAGCFPVKNPTTGETDWLPAYYFKGYKGLNPAALLGRLGGLKKSEKKARAARRNGKKGGKPRTDYKI